MHDPAKLFVFYFVAYPPNECVLSKLCSRSCKFVCKFLVSPEICFYFTLWLILQICLRFLNRQLNLNQLTINKSRQNLKYLIIFQWNKAWHFNQIIFVVDPANLFVFYVVADPANLFVFYFVNDPANAFLYYFVADPPYLFVFYLWLILQISLYFTL